MSKMPLGGSIMMSSAQQKSISSQGNLQKDQEDIMSLAAKQTSNESKVGKMLSESTQIAVITLVLSMLLSAAALDL
jgi:ABC-type glycerol-3-phosphate transport system permease component